MCFCLLVFLYRFHYCCTVCKRTNLLYQRKVKNIKGNGLTNAEPGRFFKKMVGEEIENVKNK